MTDYLRYKVKIAKQTGDVNAAILFAYFENERKKKGNNFSSTAKEIQQGTMLTTRQQKSARKALVKSKLLIEKVSGMPASLHYSIIQTESDAPSKDPAPLFHISDALRPPVLDAPTISDVMDGRFDERSTGENRGDNELLEILVAEWAVVWNKNQKRTTVNIERKKTWAKAMGEGHKPSDFLKAIYGMRHDTWPERKNRNGWTYVLRHIERWIELYDDKGRAFDQPIDTKEIKGVIVPFGYEWSQEDEHLLQMGKRFDIKTEKWK